MRPLIAGLSHIFVSPVGNHQILTIIATERQDNHTRPASSHAELFHDHKNRFCAECRERAGYQHLEDIEPITVAAYIETLQRQAAPPTVKQHMAAIRMLFSWLTEKGVLAMNPAREVKTERFSRTEGKTPAFVEGEV